MELLIFAALLPVVFSLIRPDLTFDQSNDRFDLTPLIREASYDQWGDVMDGVRRSDGLDGLTRADDNAKKPDPTKRFMDALKGFQRNFDYNHPDLTDNEDLEESMQLRRDLVSYLHESHDGGRRSDQSEIDREVLIHHAVPIVMTVEGIMQLPKNYNDNE